MRLDAWKQAEDGRGYILRLFNPSHKPAAAEVKVAALDASFTSEFNGYEIQTWRVGCGRPERVGLLEDTLGEETDASRREDSPQRRKAGEEEKEGVPYDS